MLASLLRPKKRRVYADRSPFSSFDAQDAPSFLRNQTQNNDYREFIRNNNIQDIDEDDHSFDEHEHDDPESAPLLPIFSASHLGMKTKPGQLQTD